MGRFSNGNNETRNTDIALRSSPQRYKVINIPQKLSRIPQPNKSWIPTVGSKNCISVPPIGERRNRLTSVQSRISPIRPLTDQRLAISIKSSELFPHEGQNRRSLLAEERKEQNTKATRVATSHCQQAISSEPP